MKDKVITVENGNKYYILDQIENNGLTYDFGVRIINEEIIKDDYIVVEEKFSGNDIFIDKIANSDLEQQIANAFIQRMTSNL